MNNTRNLNPVVMPHPVPDDVRDDFLMGTAAVGTNTLIATLTVPAGSVFVLKTIMCRLRKVTAVNDFFISFDLVRRGVTSRWRFEAGIVDTHNYISNPNIVLYEGDTITVQGVNNTGGNVNTFVSYHIDEYFI